MKIEIISRGKNSRRLLLIFSGWSCGPSVIGSLHSDILDIAVAYDYSSLEFDRQILEGYSSVTVWGWSLGVSVAAATLAGCDKVTEAVAINGTLTPVDDELGIPADIYAGTASNLDKRNLGKFRLRMAGSRDAYVRDFGVPEVSGSEIESLRNQLFEIEKLSLTSADRPLPWRRAYISQNDRIFPAVNMERAWKRYSVEIVSVPGNHLPDFSHIFKIEVPDYGIIGKNFAAALPRYDSAATIQARIAHALAEAVESAGMRRCARMLEFGAGSGMLTRRIAGSIHPESLTVVDLIKLNPFELCSEERYFETDAESWVASATEKFDLVASSSTFQWLSDLRGFLHDCHGLLEDDGILAFSVFLRGNMHELDSLRPVPLRYHSFEEINEWLLNDYDLLAGYENEEELRFGSVRDLLRHLRDTGVSGSAPAGSSAISLRSIDRLTYRYAVFVARKKR